MQGEYYIQTETLTSIGLICNVGVVYNDTIKRLKQLFMTTAEMENVCE